MHRARDFSAPLPPHQWQDWGHKALGGYTSRRADPKWPQGTPAHKVSLLHTKLGKEGGRDIWSGFGVTFGMVFVFPRDCELWWSPAFLGWLSTCLSKGSREWMPYFALLVHTFLLYLLVFISSHEFSHFYSSQTHGRGGSGAELPPGVKPQQCHNLVAQYSVRGFWLRLGERLQLQGDPASSSLCQ